MKKTFLLVVATMMVAVLAKAQDRADQQHLENENSFSMIILGDPQGYTKYDINQPIFELCTAWIADNVDNLNIKAVLCTGDVVEQNDNNALDRRMLNQTSRQMYEVGSLAFARLDNKVPYIISPGNHEYGYRSSENGQSHFNEYFTAERNSCYKETLIAEFPNRSGMASLENSAFEIKDKNWGSILIITTEFAPRDEVLEWARTLADSDKYKDHTIIFMTHSFLLEKTFERTDKEGYQLSPANWGQQVWDKLIYPAKHIDFVLCGHRGWPGSFANEVAYRVDKNAGGRNVHQMMFNIQTLGGGWEGNGGDGWLRILEFMPDGRTIKVKTYSPLFGISPTTKQFAHRTDPYDQFDMVLDKK